MIAGNIECPSLDFRKDPGENRSGNPACRAFQALNKWQIRQYRTAVDENKWYMGERLDREVAWNEAELDFLSNGCYGCAEIWREEYCTAICAYYQKCLLGRRFNGQV